METFSALLAICAGNSPVPGEFPAQRPVTRSFDIFFDLHPNKRLSKQWWGWWFETPSCPLWRHRNVTNLCYATIQKASNAEGVTWDILLTFICNFRHTTFKLGHVVQKWCRIGASIDFFVKKNGVVNWKDDFAWYSPMFQTTSRSIQLFLEICNIPEGSLIAIRTSDTMALFLFVIATCDHIRCIQGNMNPTKIVMVFCLIINVS